MLIKMKLNSEEHTDSLEDSFTPYSYEHNYPEIYMENQVNSFEHLDGRKTHR